MIRKIIFFQVLIIIVLCGLIIRKRMTTHISVNTLTKGEVKRTMNSEGTRYMYEPRPNSQESARESWLDEKVTYTYNSDGLHDRFNYSVKHESNTFRIITLGDSFTFGMNVSTRHNWTELLEDELRLHGACGDTTRFEVINLGVSGYDTNYVLQRYLQKGDKYRPDLIIWTIFDPERNEERAGEYIEKYKQMSLTELTQLFKKEVGYGDPEVYFREAMEYAIARKKVSLEMRGKNTVAFNLAHINSLINVFPKHLLFVGMSEQKNEYEKNIYQTLTDKHKQISYFSIIPKNDMLLRDGHLNKYGHKIVMQTIFKMLKDLRWLECKQ